MEPGSGDRNWRRLSGRIRERGKRSIQLLAGHERSPPVARDGDFLAGLRMRPAARLVRNWKLPNPESLTDSRAPEQSRISSKERVDHFLASRLFRRPLEQRVGQFPPWSQYAPRGLHRHRQTGPGT